jgi:hypothetical protein
MLRSLLALLMILLAAPAWREAASAAAFMAPGFTVPASPPFIAAAISSSVFWRLLLRLQLRLGFLQPGVWLFRWQWQWVRLWQDGGPEELTAKDKPILKAAPGIRVIGVL